MDFKVNRIQSPAERRSKYRYMRTFVNSGTARKCRDWNWEFIEKMKLQVQNYPHLYT